MAISATGYTDLAQATTHLEEITALLAEPSGFSRLSLEQRKFTLAVVIGSIVPADGKVKPCEMEMLESLLAGRMQTRGRTLREALLLAKSQTGHASAVKLPAARLADLLGIEDRCALIGMLWDIALCDHELHAHEEKLIYSVADMSGVPRKKVAEQQARSASKVT